MKVLYCVLQLDGAEIITEAEVAALANVKPDSVVVKNLSKCTAGNHRHFGIVADLYIWTCKYWYGTYRTKLTFVEIRGLGEAPLFLILKYAEKMRLVIASPKLSIFDSAGLKQLKVAEHLSKTEFNAERISNLKPIIPALESYYDLLFIRDNPFV
jgi:hypothetical protein